MTSSPETTFRLAAPFALLAFDRLLLPVTDLCCSASDARRRSEKGVHPARPVRLARNLPASSIDQPFVIAQASTSAGSKFRCATSNAHALDWPRFHVSPLNERLIAHLVASQKIPIWVKGLETQRVLDHYAWHEVGPDHQFHCAAYARLARLARRAIRPPLVGLISLQRGAKRDRGRFRELSRGPWPG